MSYDDTVDFASATADEKGWQLLQDTTLENYVEIPSLIMEGYARTRSSPSVSPLLSLTSLAFEPHGGKVLPDGR